MKRPFFSRKTSKHEQSNASSPQPLKENFGRIKKEILFIALIAVSILGNAQKTLVLQPDNISGKDATIASISNIYWDGDRNNTNYGNIQVLATYAWTFGGDPGMSRFLIEFDLSSIPKNCVISSAKLSLYHSGETQSALSGSNAVLIQRITEPWDESTVTWNNQPASTPRNQIIIPQTTSDTQNSIDIDVTNLVSDVYGLYPNYGFLFKLETEEYYRRSDYASSDNINARFRPKLVVEYELLKPVAVANGPESACSGTMLSLDGNSSISTDFESTNLSYKWSSNFLTIPKDTMPKLSLISPNVSSVTNLEFYLQVFDDGIASDFDTLTVVVNPAPEVPVIQQFGDTLLASTAFNYQWYKDGFEIDGAMDSTFVITSSGSYRVKVANEISCVSDMSDALYVICSSVDEMQYFLRAYPNPSTDKVHISGISSDESIDISVFDLMGKRRLQTKSKDGSAIVNLSGFENGQYIVVFDNKEFKSIKIVKQ